MAYWWELFPERYQFELSELERHGYEYRRDEGAWAAGRLELAVIYSGDEANVVLRAFFPDTYPYFPPAVTAPETALPLHQDPVSKLLCLLPEDSSGRDPKGDRAVHPVGCLHPTFTGAALDINQVALAAVRVVASTLCGGAEAAYPEMPWDFAVVNFRTEDGRAIPPEWATAALVKHPECDHL